MIRKFWSPEEDAVLHARYADEPTHVIAQTVGRSERSVYQRAASLGLTKSASYLASPAAGRLRPGAKIGGATRFRAGHSTWNAGRSGWKAGGRSSETQFQPGQMPHNHKPLGHERINGDGVLERKVAEPKTFRPVHVLVWEEAHGPIPAGMIVVFKDRNQANIVLDNLELVTRAENMRRNSVHTRYPKEVVQLIRLRGALNKQINKRTKA